MLSDANNAGPKDSKARNSANKNTLANKKVVKQQPEVHEEIEEVESKACALKEALMYQGITGSIRADNSTLKVSVIDTISVVTGVNDNHAALMLPRLMQNDPDHM